MTPPPNIPYALAFDGRGINDGTDPYKPRLLTMSNTCPAELARACAALPQLLQALETAAVAGDHGADVSLVAYEARQALTAAGYTFNS